jgi:hypothetical protein
VDQQLLDYDEFLAEINDRLQPVQDLIKGNYDQHHQELKFAEGDWIWLHLPPLGCHANRQGTREAHSQVLWVVLGAGPHRPYCIQVGVVTQVMHP